jgi:formylglycine-generating enzyme required for sulfatase activity
MRKGKPKSPPEENEVVKLKPLWGIQPPTYLGLFYGIALTLILFFLLVFPGLYRHGSLVTIHTLPQGASVYIDGVRVGSSPLTTFIEAGSHSLQIRKMGFIPATETIAVEGRVFGSLFFPRKVELRIPLKLESSEILLGRGYEELASWVLAETPTPIRPYPPILRNLASNLTRLASVNPLPAETWNTFFLQCVPQINSEGAFQDFLSALFLVHSEGKVLTHRSMLDVLQFFTTLLNSQPNTLYWLEAILPSSVSSAFRNHPVVSQMGETLSKERKEKSMPPSLPTVKQQVIRIGGMEFSLIPEGSFYKGWALPGDASGTPESMFIPYQVRISPFYLLSTEVTEEQFAKFLQETPSWSPSARETLKKQGLADEGYLTSWKDSPEPSNPSYPIREVSYFAAKAYCRWLESKYPAYRFDLPTEAEWEWAASLNAGSPPNSFPPEIKPVHLGERGRWGLRFMLGNVWEWTEDWFAPFQHLFPEVSLNRGVEKIVKGGSYINSPESITVSTRGSQPPSWCTPYLGFRVKATPR